MKRKNVSIIDYGMGNLLSVAHAFEKCNARVSLIEANQDISEVDYLILPGVGAFPDGMEELTRRSLIHVIQSFVATERPVLGICLGMQMLFDSSEEFGHTKGLGIIPGKVELINSENNLIKLPFVGWSNLEILQDGYITKGVNSHHDFYFVHSFEAMPDSKEHLIAYTEYSERKIAAIVKKDNVIGCQFHPEKSSKTGLNLISNFLDI